jgi:hypothetical protein
VVDFLLPAAAAEVEGDADIQAAAVADGLFCKRLPFILTKNNGHCTFDNPTSESPKVQRLGFLC